MKRGRLILTGILALMIVMVGVLACVNPEKDLKNAEKKVEQSSVKEEPSLYDNGKNFFVINAINGSNAAYGYDFFVAATQKWVDNNPNKKIISVDNPSHSYIWVVYYEDRNWGCK